LKLTVLGVDKTTNCYHCQQQKVTIQTVAIKHDNYSQNLDDNSVHLVIDTIVHFSAQ